MHFNKRQWHGLAVLLRAIWRLILVRLHCRKPRPRPDRGCCLDLTPDVLKRPDPLLYSQFYLMDQGLSVTWNNPDIQLHEPDPGAPGGVGAAVSSGKLQPDHVYKVRVRVWNGSYHAPAPGLPVHLTYLSFGAGTKSHFVGTRNINLGVKGSATQPAFAVFDWKTPAGAGHYCLRAALSWPDDANPNNNLGQENTNVAPLQSPASFTFTLRNDASVRRRFVLEADAYDLPPLDPCDERTRRPTRIEESRARWVRAREKHSYGMFPVPPEWTVTIDPPSLSLAALEEQLIHVSIEPKFPFTGTKPFNVNAFAVSEDGRRQLAGGVTLTVTKG